MLEIRNVEVTNLERSVIACRNAMRLTMPEYTEEEFKESLPRAIKLCQASKNDEHIKCHDNFLTGIRVSFDIKYPQYITPQLQRYNWIDIVTSQSKMHKLLKLNIARVCNKYVTQETIDQMRELIRVYNQLAKKEYQDNVIKEKTLYLQWMKIISNCPMGLELFMQINTNYKQLQTIYWQRKNHKLKEDWGAFIKFVEGLPYFKEFILGEGGDNDEELPKDNEQQPLEPDTDSPHKDRIEQRKYNKE